MYSCIRYVENKDDVSAKDDLLVSSDEESQSEDDEEGWMLTEEVEKDFYKTLSQIKNKDPTIYKKDAEFFKNIPAHEKKQKQAKKSNPLTLKEYERKLVLEHGGQLSDEEDDTFVPTHPRTYVEEQEELKKSLRAAVYNEEDDDEDEERWGGLFKKKEKTKQEKKTEGESYKQWLQGQKETADDAEAETSLKPLHDFWTDPNLNDGDKFLRDYIVNKKFLESEENKEEGPELVGGLSSDDAEEEVEEEKKLPKHRFEEADQEFIKRYPRVMANSMRVKKDSRKTKREEVKERKIKEKEKKVLQMKLKKKEKKREIEEKIEELKKLTGNDQLAFENVTKDDFDLDEHDMTMKRLFNDEFYAQQDPDFHPDYGDQADGVEEWNYEGGDIGEEMNEEGFDESGAISQEDYYEPAHCEDPDFNMDCDYDPVQAAKDKGKGRGESRSRRRKDKHRRTTVSEAVAQPKPQFDPTAHESFQRYFDQYYAIDCEDFIGDLPCRYKYRRTVPNSYGLTIEEILSADVGELERWCSIKRIRQLRPDHKERGDVKVFGKRAHDDALKRKILPSLYRTKEEEVAVDNDNKKKKKKEASETNDTKEPEASQSEVTESVKKRKKKKNKDKLVSEVQAESTPDVTEGGQTGKKRKREETKVVHKTKKNKSFHDGRESFKNKKIKKDNKSFEDAKKQTEDPILPGMSDARLLAYGIKPKKFKNKLKYQKTDADAS